MVRIFTIILALYLLALPFWPCADEAMVGVSQQVIAEMQVDDHVEGDHEHGSEADGCSPFCLCHCCHTHIVLPTIFIDMSGAIAFSSYEVPYQKSWLSTYQYSLLRPPQV